MDPSTDTTPPARFAGLRTRLDTFRQTRFWHYARWPTLIGGGLFGLLVLFVVFLYFTVNLPKDLPEVQSSMIVDVKGREVAVLEKDGLRVEVKLGDVAPVVVDALIAAEDRRFYKHGGVDPAGIARAIKNNLRGGSTQGGSTLTQQLVKNSYLTRERTVTRKIKEAVLAIKLERTEDKRQILERYLNTVYFGRGAYGIEAASRVYFDTTAKNLTTEQAALLIGLLRAPESADPTTDPATAKKRRDAVLDDLVEVGKLTKAEAGAEKAKPIAAKQQTHSVDLTSGLGAHFVEWVRQQAISEFGESAVYGGGLKIITTLDLDDQRAAEEAVKSVLTDPNDPQAALVAVDRDGAIKAYVGGRDYATLKVDLARGKEGGGSGRQPGSTFKPFVLATALENGITLGSRYPAPPTISIDTGSGPYEVSNYGGESFGTIDLTTATANSVNTVYAQLMSDVGPKKVVDEAKKIGITSPLEPNLSLTLGTEEVSVLEMTGSYLTFARDGDRAEPFSISRVEGPDGSVLFEVPRPSGERAIPEGQARAVNYALQQVVARGTGKAAKLKRPVAGKTGTTQGNGDAWFAGYTPNYAAVVWMGYPEGPDHAMVDVHGVHGVTGGTLPAQIWKRFMDKALTDVEKVDFAPPPKELLAAPQAPATSLQLSPSSGKAGDTIIATGTGYERCTAGWYITFEPGGVRTTPEVGSTEDRRSATFQVPAGVADGQGAATAWCDEGAGASAVAKAAFVIGDPTSTTSSSTTSSTTSTTKPERTTTTKPKDTTTTSATTTTTTGG